MTKCTPRRKASTFYAGLRAGRYWLWHSKSRKPKFPSKCSNASNWTTPAIKPEFGSARTTLRTINTATSSFVWVIFFVTQSETQILLKTRFESTCSTQSSHLCCSSTYSPDFRDSISSRLSKAESPMIRPKKVKVSFSRSNWPTLSSSKGRPSTT